MAAAERSASSCAKRKKSPAAGLRARVTVWSFENGSAPATSTRRLGRTTLASCLCVDLRGEGATYPLKALAPWWRDIAQRSEYAHIQGATWASPACAVAALLGLSSLDLGCSTERPLLFGTLADSIAEAVARRVGIRPLVGQQC